MDTNQKRCIKSSFNTTLALVQKPNIILKKMINNLLAIGIA